MNIRLGITLGLLLTGYFCICSLTVAATKSPTTKHASTQPGQPKSKSENELLSEQLASPDTATQQQALDRIKEILAKPGNAGVDAAPWKVNAAFDSWIKSLLKVHRYDDADVLALEGIRRRAVDVNAISGFQKCRVQAFLAVDKDDAALSAAKGYYNVCSLKDSAAAIDLIGVCLANARPDQKGIVRRFKNQQVAGATTQPSTQPAHDNDNILNSIVIDPKQFEEAIQALKFRDFDHLLAKGNLLLLSDRAKEAKECFEMASELAQGQRQILSITESVARAIRAEYGAIGPANAFILAQQGN